MITSVLVPSYNHAPFIERTLRSIFAQTLPPKKLIVIDDGSKDESPVIIERILQDCPFDCEFIKRENRGVSATLNEGLSKSIGDYFAYISSDDVWLPKFLESRVKILESRPDAVLAYGHAYLIDEQDRIIENTQNWGEYVDGNALSMLLYPVIPTSASVLYRREILQRYLWNEESILEDYELYLRLTGAGAFALDENILSAWRQHGYNTSANFSLMKDEWLDAQRRVAPELGLNEEEIQKIQTKFKYNCVADFIRRGQKREALKLLWQNRAGAPSLVSIGKLLFRFLIPNQLFQWRKNLVGRQATEKYGVLRY